MTTKIVKWWKRISFWNKIRILLTSLGIGGEITLYFGDAYIGWNWVAGLATLALLGLTLFVTDTNNDGVVDGLEDKK